MTITRRGFLASTLAAGAAPFVCKAENLMRIVVPEQKLIVPSLARTLDQYGDLYHITEMDVDEDEVYVVRSPNVWAQSDSRIQRLKREILRNAMPLEIFRSYA